MYISKLDTRIQEERLQILVQNLPSSLLGTMVVSIFMFFILIDKVDKTSALIWISLVSFLTLARILHVNRMLNNRNVTYIEEESLILWGVFFSGLLLSSSVFVIFPYDDITLQLLMFFILSSMIAGSAAVYSTHFISFLTYSLPVILAFLYKASTLPDMLSLMFFVGLTYYMFLFATMFRIHRSVIKFLKTQYLNHDLAANLSSAKEELEETNNELKVENLAREETEKRLYHLANYDPLTALANRHLFKENLKDSMKESKNKGSTMALLFLDLDNFKIINDTLGHAMGDKLLIAASSRLKSLLGSKNSIARLGGDEFVIIINDAKDNLDISTLADNIIKLIEKPFSFDDHEMFIGTSIGISIYPKDTTDRETLLSYADTAMYAAKNKGKNTYQFFTSAMHEEILSRHDIETKLHHAIEKNEFRIEYQPKVDLSTEKVIGAEALLRWTQEELGNVSPSVFIPIAEDSSLISIIGKWVIEQVCKDMAHLKDNFNNQLRISVNVSSAQILHQNLPQLIHKNLNKYGLHSSCLELEVTENMLVEQSRKSQQVLHELEGMGIKLSIDDFGTGYSSLNYLKTLPIHILKIDKSFISDTPNCEGVCAITKSIIALAHNLNLEVVAEGVETPEQLKFLKENGCNIIQGFYFSKPLDISAFSAYLNAPENKIKQALLS